MKVSRMILASVVMGLCLSLPVTSFAMGGRKGKAGNQQNHFRYDARGSGHDNHQEDQDHDDQEEEDGDDFVGNFFFGQNAEGDPFPGFSSSETQEGGPDNPNGKGPSKDDTYDFDECDYSEFEYVINGQDVPADPNAIPEPMTMSLMLLGGAGMGLLRRKSKA